MKKAKSSHTISVVLPCLNEEKTLAASIHKAKAGIAKTKLSGEVIVADNGSKDHSMAVAKKAGARVVEIKKKGYGAALMGGFAAAKGDILVMGDADDTYDFREIPLLYTKLQEGFDFVSGNRLKGKLDPLAMPWLHQHIGVPALTLALNLFFPTGIWDGHCGFRMFTRSAYDAMRLNKTGMEYASEMLIKARMAGLRMAEAPIRYGARHTKSYSKLNTFRDGFRHLWLIGQYALGFGD